MKVCLDFGHGGKDPGANHNGLMEKDIVLDVGLRVNRLLSATKVEVLLTRDKDVFVELSERANMANNWGADLFVSIHVNSAASGQGYGFESYTYLQTSEKTEQNRAIIHREVSSLFRRDRGMQRANFAVLRETKMAACLLECGFINHPEDAKDLVNDEFRDKLALAIANGILKVAGEGKEEGSERILHLADWQWGQLLAKMKIAKTLNKFADEMWLTKTQNKTLTVDELGWLTYHILVNILVEDDPYRDR